MLEEHKRELAEVRVAADERLRDVHILHDALNQANQYAEQLQSQLWELTQRESRPAPTAEAAPPPDPIP